MCAGLEAGIEDATHAVGQQKLERVREQRREEEDTDDSSEEEEEEEGGGIVSGLTDLTIETEGTEEETEEQLTASLKMEVEEDRGSKVEDEGGGTQRALGALEFLTQEAEPS